MKKQISIPCFKTILDAMDKGSPEHLTSRLFFSTLANESGKTQSLRKHYGIITKPIFNLLYDIIFEMFEEYEKVGKDSTDMIKKLDILESILAGLDYDIFELDMYHEESIFEMARLLNDEEGVDINLVSNNKKLEEVKKRLIKENKDYDFEIISTDKWIAKHIAET